MFLLTIQQVNPADDPLDNRPRIQVQGRLHGRQQDHPRSLLPLQQIIQLQDQVVDRVRNRPLARVRSHLPSQLGGHLFARRQYQASILAANRQQNHLQLSQAVQHPNRAISPVRVRRHHHPVCQLLGPRLGHQVCHFRGRLRSQATDRLANLARDQVIAQAVNHLNGHRAIRQVIQLLSLRQFRQTILLCGHLHDPLRFRLACHQVSRQRN